MRARNLWVVFLIAGGGFALAADEPVPERATDARNFGISVRDVAPEPFHAVTVRREDDRSVVVVQTANRFLDLDAQVKDCADDPTTRAVAPLAPPMAVGEGPDPDNHTLVRLLSAYGLCEVQFLAYPPEVRGGVGIDCGRFLEQGEYGIATHPLSDGAVRELRLFNSAGGFAGAFAPPESLAAPFVVCAGDFDPSHDGDELAVASRNQASGEAAISIMGGQGQLIRTVSIQNAGAGECDLSARRTAAGPTELLFYNKESRRLFAVGPEGRASAPTAYDELPSGRSLAPTVFNEGALLAFGPEERLSRVMRVSPSGRNEVLDVGAKENLFWFAPKADWAKRKEVFTEGQYVRQGEYAFQGSVSFWTKPVQSAQLATSYSDYVTKDFLESGRLPEALRGYAEGRPKLWAPIMTHRWNKTPFTLQILDTLDPATGLPRYATLDVNNQRVGYVEAAKKESDTEQKKGEFGIGTYAFGIPELEAMYTFPLRGFLRELAKKERQAPDGFLGVEPNHEHEIVSSKTGEDSIGDYNPTFLAGFYRYLMSLEGSLENVNATFGTPFTPGFFDGPRNKGRGAWDTYDEANPYFQKWFEYNRFVIYRRVAQNDREALLAGFAPETITSHQIPDVYSVGSLEFFSKPIRRVTPIDWMLTSGANYGYTKYGFWCDRPQNVAQGAWTSGFNMVAIGEYQARSRSAENAYRRLAYLQQHGTYFIHVMYFEKFMNDSEKAALDRLVAENDAPRPGATGGVEQVRPYRDETRAFDLVSLGNGPDNTGLIKSVREDGSWEGTVYVAPFHAHVDVTRVARQNNLTVNREGTSIVSARDVYFGQQFEFAFEARALSGASGLRLQARSGGRELPGQTIEIGVGPRKKHCRLIYKFAQPLADVSFSLAATETPVGIEALDAYRHEEKTTQVNRGIFAGERHKGGVTFDLLDSRR